MGSDEGWFRLMSASCLWVKSPLSGAQLMILLMVEMQGVNIDGNLGEYSC